MKKTLLLLCSLALLFAFLCPAAADLVWEPMDDFYNAHLKDCTEAAGRYGALSRVQVVSSPENDAPVKTIEQGESFGICARWGDQWALLSDESGWVELTNCARYYDESDFYAEHSSEFVKPEKQENITLEDDLIVWSFPGSGKYETVMGLYDIGFTYATIQYKWTDADGRLWAQVDNIYQMNNRWICLSDKTGTSLPKTARMFADSSVDEAQFTTAPATTAAPATTTAEKPPFYKKSFFLPAILVLCVMLVTGFIIASLSRKNKQKNAAAANEPADAVPAETTKDENESTD